MAQELKAYNVVATVDVKLTDALKAEIEAQAMRLVSSKNREIKSLKAKIRELGGNA